MEERVFERASGFSGVNGFLLFFLCPPRADLGSIEVYLWLRDLLFFLGQDKIRVEQNRGFFFLVSDTGYRSPGCLYMALCSSHIPPGCRARPHRIVNTLSVQSAAHTLWACPIEVFTSAAMTA